MKMKVFSPKILRSVFAFTLAIPMFIATHQAVAEGSPSELILLENSEREVELIDVRFKNTENEEEDKVSFFFNWDYSAPQYSSISIVHVDSIFNAHLSTSLQLATEAVIAAIGDRQCVKTVDEQNDPMYFVSHDPRELTFTDLKKTGAQDCFNAIAKIGYDGLKNWAKAFNKEHAPNDWDSTIYHLFHWN